jgi:hypothetical protein
MKQPIAGFHLDEENHWVADLACGHKQHVRHDPPWMERPWVITPEGRASRLGMELNCKRCDEMGAVVAEAVRRHLVEVLTKAYHEAGLSGLCDEGRWDYALDHLKTATLNPTIEAALAAAVAADTLRP